MTAVSEASVPDVTTTRSALASSVSHCGTSRGGTGAKWSGASIMA
mgnify:CR=1 FL=1